MIARVENGAELLCNTLESLGVEHVFGVPGTQSVMLYDALRRSIHFYLNANFIREGGRKAFLDAEQQGKNQDEKAC
jgi:hypothetical protein